MTIDIDQNLVAQAMEQQPGEIEFPISIYDIKIASADGSNPDILGGQKGKVTLLFNVAAGCGNIPQHGVIEQLNQIYRDEPDFSIIAVTVDDFVCHGYAEFQDGLDKYIEKNKLQITPGELAKKYAVENFNSTYEFTELTNGRHDKHTYDPAYAPGAVKMQDQHELWKYLTMAFNADLQDNGVPYHNEEVPWSNAKPNFEPSKKIFNPLTGNFTKFLIDKTGKKVRRYANGFLLGERNINGDTFPWFPEKYQSDGRRDHNPITEHREDLPENMKGNFPTPLQNFGIDVSLKMISRDIDEYLRAI